MISEILIQILQDLKEIKELNFIGEDWGQLNIEQPPVNFPCALVDIETMAHTNLKVGSQRSTITVTITIADIRYNTANANNPVKINNNSFSIFNLLDKIQAVMQSKEYPQASPLIRLSTQKIRRQDAIREFEVVYTFRL